MGGVAVLAMVVLVGSAAWACTPQAGIKGSPSSGTAGTKVTITGSTFDPAGGPVKVWWGGSGRELLGEINVSSTRAFTFTFEVPSSANGGAHIVAATQNDANGNPVAGSPANMTFRVDGAPAAAPAASVVQGVPDETSVLEPTPATADAPAAAAAPAPAAARATRTAPAPVPAPAAAPAAAATAAPAPVVAATEPAPAPVAAPAEAFRTPAPVAEPAVAAVDPARSESGTSGWLLAGLAVLALGSLAVGTGIVLTERKRVHAKA